MPKQLFLANLVDPSESRYVDIDKVGSFMLARHLHQWAAICLQGEPTDMYCLGWGASSDVNDIQERINIMYGLNV